MVLDLVIHRVLVDKDGNARGGPLDDETIFRQFRQFFADRAALNDHKAPRLIVQYRRGPGPGPDDLHKLFPFDWLVRVLPDAPARINSFKQVHDQIIFPPLYPLFLSLPADQRIINSILSRQCQQRYRSNPCSARTEASAAGPWQMRFGGDNHRRYRICRRRQTKTSGRGYLLS